MFKKSFIPLGIVLLFVISSCGTASGDNKDIIPFAIKELDLGDFTAETIDSYQLLELPDELKNSRQTSRAVRFGDSIVAYNNYGGNTFYQYDLKTLEHLRDVTFKATPEVLLYKDRLATLDYEDGLLSFYDFDLNVVKTFDLGKTYFANHEYPQLVDDTHLASTRTDRDSEGKNTYYCCLLDLTTGEETVKAISASGSEKEWAPAQTIIPSDDGMFIAVAYDLSEQDSYSEQDNYVEILFNNTADVLSYRYAKRSAFI